MPNLPAFFLIARLDTWRWRAGCGKLFLWRILGAGTTGRQFEGVGIQDASRFGMRVVARHPGRSRPRAALDPNRPLRRRSHCIWYSVFHLSISIIGSVSEKEQIAHDEHLYSPGWYLSPAAHFL